MQYLFFQSLSLSESHKRFLLHTHGFMNYYSQISSLNVLSNESSHLLESAIFFQHHLECFTKTDKFLKKGGLCFVFEEIVFLVVCVCVCGGEHFSSRKKFKECKLVSKHRLQELLMVSKSLAKSIKSSNIRSCLFRFFCY